MRLLLELKTSSGVGPQAMGSSSFTAPVCAQATEHWDGSAGAQHHKLHFSVLYEMVSPAWYAPGPRYQACCFLKKHPPAPGWRNCWRHGVARGSQSMINHNSVMEQQTILRDGISVGIVMFPLSLEIPVMLQSLPTQSQVHFIRWCTSLYGLCGTIAARGSFLRLTCPEVLAQAVQ